MNRVSSILLRAAFSGLELGEFLVNIKTRPVNDASLPRRVKTQNWIRSWPRTEGCAAATYDWQQSALWSNVCFRTHMTFSLSCRYRLHIAIFLVFSISLNRSLCFSSYPFLFFHPRFFLSLMGVAIMPCLASSLGRSRLDQCFNICFPLVLSLALSSELQGFLFHSGYRHSSMFIRISNRVVRYDTIYECTRECFRVYGMFHPFRGYSMRVRPRFHTSTSACMWHEKRNRKKWERKKKCELTRCSGRQNHGINMRTLVTGILNPECWSEGLWYKYAEDRILL